MNTPLQFDNEGAHFRISNSEYVIFDDLSWEMHDQALDSLPIGKATELLRNVIYAAAEDIVVVDENDKVIVESDMDGSKASHGVLQQNYEPLLRHAVLDIGRVTISVINGTELENSDAEPIYTKVLTSKAYRWAEGIVAAHRAQLYEDPNMTPTIQSSIAEADEGSDTTLALQGLTLRETEFSAGSYEIVRLAA